MSAPTPHETILGILAAKPQHGYHLLEHFNQPDRLGRVWSLSTSQLYAVLKRLEADGLVEGQVVSGSDAPARKEYSISELGKQRLLSWIDDPSPSPSIRRVRIDFLSRLYVARLLELPTPELIHNQLLACEDERQRQIARQQAEPPDTLEPIVEDFILGQLEAAIAWLNRLAEQELSPTQKIDPHENS